MITAPVEVEISVEELKTIYRATCRRSGRKPVGLDKIHRRRDFIARVRRARDGNWTIGVTDRVRSKAQDDWVCVAYGPRGSLRRGIFTDLDRAEQRIEQHGLMERGT